MGELSLIVGQLTHSCSMVEHQRLQLLLLNRSFMVGLGVALCTAVSEAGNYYGVVVDGAAQ